MKQPVRSFSIGLFAAAIILLAIVLFFDEQGTKTNSQSQQEMIQSLKKDGLRVLSEEEYISLSVQNEPENKEKDETEKNTNKEQSGEDKDKDKNKPDKEVKTYKLKIEPGLASSSSISSLLEENGIIDKASKFNKYLEKNDYSQYVQIGTFELTSDMTFNEVAETITN